MDQTTNDASDEKEIPCAIVNGRDNNFLEGQQNQHQIDPQQYETNNLTPSASIRVSSQEIKASNNNVNNDELPNVLFKKMVEANQKRNSKMIQKLEIERRSPIDSTNSRSQQPSIKVRFIVCFLALIGLSLSQMSRMVLNIAITSMVDPRLLPKDNKLSDGSCPIRSVQQQDLQIIDDAPTEQSIIDGQQTLSSSSNQQPVLPNDILDVNEHNDSLDKFKDIEQEGTQMAEEQRNESSHQVLGDQTASPDDLMDNQHHGDDNNSQQDNQSSIAEEHQTSVVELKNQQDLDDRDKFSQQETNNNGVVEKSLERNDANGESVVESQQNDDNGKSLSSLLYDKKVEEDHVDTQKSDSHSKREIVEENQKEEELNDLGHNDQELLETLSRERHVSDVTMVTTTASPNELDHTHQSHDDDTSNRKTFNHHYSNDKTNDQHQELQINDDDDDDDTRRMNNNESEGLDKSTEPTGRDGGNGFRVESETVNNQVEEDNTNDNQQVIYVDDKSITYSQEATSGQTDNETNEEKHDLSLTNDSADEDKDAKIASENPLDNSRDFTSDLSALDTTNLSHTTTTTSSTLEHNYEYHSENYQAPPDQIINDTDTTTYSNVNDDDADKFSSGSTIPSAHDTNEIVSMSEQVSDNDQPIDSSSSSSDHQLTDQQQEDHVSVDNDHIGIVSDLPKDGDYYPVKYVSQIEEGDCDALSNFVDRRRKRRSIQDDLVTTGEDPYEQEEDGPDVIESLEDKFGWDTKAQNIVLGGFYSSYFVFMIIGSRLAEIYGSKYIIMISVFGSALVNLFTPWMAKTSFNLLVASRVLLGAMQSGIFPGCYALFAQWLTLNETSIFAPLIKVSLRLGSMLGSFLPGLIIKKGGFGWQNVFYTTGALCLLWSIPWLFLVTSFPENNRFISKAELSHTVKKKRKFNKTDIEATPMDELPATHSTSSTLKSQPVMQQHQKKQNHSTPWLNIITSGSVIALTAVKLSFNYVVDFMCIQLPSYLKYVHHADEQETSWIITLMFAIQVVLVTVVAWYAKEAVRRRPFGLNKTGIRKLFQGTASFGAALLLLLVTWNNCSLIYVGVCFQILSILTMFVAGGEVVLPYDLSDEFQATIMGIANSVANLSGITVVYMTTQILGDQGSNADRWHQIIKVIAGISFLGGLVFCLLAKAESIDFRSSKRARKERKNLASELASANANTLTNAGISKM